MDGVRTTDVTCPQIDGLWNGICYLLQAQHDIDNGDMVAAGRHWHTAFQWLWMGAIVWVAVILPLFLMGLTLLIVFTISSSWTWWISLVYT